MNSLRVRRTTLLACLVSSSLLAQGRVWTVDLQNRPGADFTDLPSAVAAASDGDLIRVRAVPAQAYAATTTSKGLSLLGERTDLYWPEIGGLTITSLPAGRQAVVQGLVIRPPFNSPYGHYLRLVGNQGRVLLDRLYAYGAPLIEQCRQVQINDCSFYGQFRLFMLPLPPLTIRDAVVTLAGCSITGVDAFNVYDHQASPALDLERADVTVARSQLRGGLGVAAPTPDAPAVLASASRLVVSGDAQAIVRSGDAGIGLAPAIATSNGGSVTKDPNVTLVSAGAPITGNATVTTTWLPSLRATGAPPASIVNADLFSPAGDVIVFLTSLSADPIALGAGGDWWLDPVLFFVTGVAVQGSSGHTAHAIPLANDPGLSFGAWTLQAVSGTFAGGFKLSNAAGYALR